MNKNYSPHTAKSRLILGVDLWVWLAVIIVGGTLATLSVLRYTGYNAGMLDIGNMSQAVWSATQGQPLLYTREGGTFSRLSWHVEVIYFLLAPLYALFPSPVTLLVVQAVLFALGALPAFALAQRKLGNLLAARLIAYIYLLYPVAQTAVLFDFHGDTLAMPLLMFALNALDHRAWKRYALWLLLALSCKYYVAVAVVCLGIIIYSKGEHRVGTFTLLAGIIWGGIAFFMVRPYFSPPSAAEVHATVDGYIQFYFGQLQFLLTPHAITTRLMTIVVVFAPALWLGWRAWWWLLPAAAITFPSLLSIGTVSASDYRFHHYAITVPFLIMAIIHGAGALRQRQRNAPVGQSYSRPWRINVGMNLAITLLFASILIDIPLNPLFWIAPPNWGLDDRAYGRTNRDAIKDDWLNDYVPHNVPVATSMFIAPHIVNREVLYLFEYVDGTDLQLMTERLDAVDYAVADALFDFSVPLPDVSPEVQTGVPALTALVGVGHQPSSTGMVFHDVAAITQLLHEPSFGLVQMRDGLLLFQRSADFEHVLNQQIIIQKATQTTHPLADFNNGISLIEVDIVYRDTGHLRMHFAWMLQPSGNENLSLFAVSRLAGVEQARIVHLPTQALYPLGKWSPKETIIEEFEVSLPDNIADGQYEVWTGWYDSRHLFAADTDSRSRVGNEMRIGIIEIDN